MFLNSSISKIFPFLIAVDSTIQIHKTWKFSLFSSPNCHIIVLIFELHISIEAIKLFSKLIFFKSYFYKFLLFKICIHLVLFTLKETSYN